MAPGRILDSDAPSSVLHGRNVDSTIARNLSTASPTLYADCRNEGSVEDQGPWSSRNEPEARDSSGMTISPGWDHLNVLRISPST